MTMLKSSQRNLRILAKKVCTPKKEFSKILKRNLKRQEENEGVLNIETSKIEGDNRGLEIEHQKRGDLK